ncbi:hypothetical protein [Ammoniphilus sp. YIM 78166]|uniref:hypothetical protein n=1 Tax=Ammoniphilus sp. YIM 78166 TaxID=1644106 RepID=UPI00106F20F6|nr:hypothetical protein [Ammoniphilus sp. YIM 78166]
MTKKETEIKMPRFDQLTDRVIAQASPGPLIGAKTNLDPENPEEYNPYRLQETPIEEKKGGEFNG